MPALFGLAMVQALHAQEALEEVTVFSQRRVESLEQAPAAITAFTESTIKAARIEQVADFIALTPGASMREQFSPSFANLTVRGITTQQNGELPIALAMDGVTAPFTSFLNEELLDVTQIEVLKGPQGGLYGRNAIAGAINITTRLPTDELTGMMRASYGNGDSVGLQAQISGPIAGERVLGKAGVSYDDSSGLLSSQLSDQKLDRSRTLTGYGRLIIQPTDDVAVDLRGKHTSADVGSSYFAVVPLSDIDKFNRGNEPLINSPAITDRGLSELSAKIDAKTSLGTFTSVTGYFDVNDRLYGDADFGVFGPPEQLQDYRVAVEGWSQELRLASADESAIRWVVGAFYQDRKNHTYTNLLEDLGGGATAPLAFVQDTHDTSRSWALFGQASYKLSDRFEALLALRNDSDKRTSRDFAKGDDTRLEHTFSKFQPKFSLSYTASDALLAYASWARGFRSGGFNGAVAPEANRIFGSELATTVEAGTKYTALEGRAYVNLSLYRTNYQGQQFFSFVDPLTSLIVNAAKTTIKGVELETTARVAEGFQVFASYAYIDGKITANAPDAFGDTFVGNYSPGINRYTANVGLQLERTLFAGRTSWITRFDYELRGPIYYELNNLQHSSSKTLLNLRTAWRTGPLTLAAYGRNLTNERYPLTAESFLGPDVAFRLGSRPRTYGVEATYDF